MKKFNIKKKHIKDFLNWKSFISLLPILFIILGIILRLKLFFLNSSFWFDTCALALNLQRDYTGLFAPLDDCQVAPPFFLVFSKLILDISHCAGNIEYRDLILRILPCFCSIMVLPLFLCVTEKMYHNKCFNCFSSFLLAFNPIAINYAIEFKQYSWELMYTVILLLIFLYTDLNNINKKRLFISSLILSLAPWVSLSSFFIIAGYLCYLLIQTIRNKNLHKSDLAILLLPFCISTFISILLFYIPVYQSIYKGMYNYWQNSLPSFFTLNNFIPLLSSRLKGILFSWISDYIILLLIINIIILFYKKNLKNICIIILPIIFTILASFFKMYPFAERLILFLLPQFIIIASQVFFITKEKLFVICLITLTFQSLNKPLPEYILHRYDNRELFEILKSNNPTLNNVISDMVIYPYYSFQKAKLGEHIWYGFKNSKIPNYINNIRNIELWIYMPINYNNYNKYLEQYLYNNNKIEIIHMYRSKVNSGTFLVHIKVH